ncbi:MAG: biotin/lipoyl-binding protein [Nitrosopumilus sp.]|nr:biotin/lipoyl-binding protein [Nitrosopumilus sp.]
MTYAVRETDVSVDARIAGRPGGGEYSVVIGGAERTLRVLYLDSRRAEFLLDGRYHVARFIEAGTGELSMSVDNVPVTLGLHAHLDEIVYKNSGGGGPTGSQAGLKSQIPGKVVSVAVKEGDEISEGDPVCTLESMKMQVAVKAHKGGRVSKVSVREGDTVARGDLVAEIE